MSKPLDGIRIIDFTHVQAGPACTQLLGFYGADVIKVERPGSGDVTRSQLRDIPDADALYFTMLNGNKRSLTLDTKTPEGKEVLEKLIKVSDVMVEESEKEKMKGVDVKGFPSFMFYSTTGTSVEYNGPRTRDSWMDFLAEQTGK